MYVWHVVEAKTKALKQDEKTDRKTFYSAAANAKESGILP